MMSDKAHTDPLDEKPDADKTFEELWPDLEDDEPMKQSKYGRRFFALFAILLMLIYIVPNLAVLLQSMHYKNIEIFGHGISIPFAKSDNPKPQGNLPKGQWSYTNATENQQILFRTFIYASPLLVKEAVDKLDSQTTVDFTNKSCIGAGKANDPHQGKYSCAIYLGVSKFKLELNSQQITNTPQGRFLLLHEVGHLVDFKLFNRQAYNAFKDAFKKSDSFKDCFKYEQGCVAPQEIFADQFAYYATNYNQNLTFYHTPQLLTNNEFAKILASTLED